MLTAQNLHLAFGDAALLEDANFTILARQRWGLVGRNGCGKSSLLKALAGFIDVDAGELVFQNDVMVQYVAQEDHFEQHDVHAVLYHALHEKHVGDELMWDADSKIHTWCDIIALAPDMQVAHLSGGQKKRLNIARAFITEPNFMLLDEPTNHMDIAGIIWLEELLKKSTVSMVVISHDRHFLNAISTHIMELDRGKVRMFTGNFYHYQEQKILLQQIEDVQNAKMDKLLSQEEIWIRKGVEARRTRAQARIERLDDLRDAQKSRRSQAGMVRFNVAQAEMSGKMVAELENICIELGGRNLVENFTTRVMRGDKVGIVGANGIGKSSLVKVITGQMAPSKGKIRLGMNIELAYFDQMRAQLDPKQTLCNIISPGSDWLTINGQRKHVMAYLNDFLFSSKRAQSLVESLSGGEKNRLLLARLFAKPSNVLVLDEPSNDLDIPTLELLEERLAEYPGTLFLISHDRSFLDHVVDYIIAPTKNPEKPAEWHYNIGGYYDWLQQNNIKETEYFSSKPTSFKAKSKSKNNSNSKDNEKTKENDAINDQKTSPLKNAHASASTPKLKRLSFQERRLLETLPKKIQEMEVRQTEILAQLPTLYQTDALQASSWAQEHADLELAILAALEQWEELTQRADIESNT